MRFCGTYRLIIRITDTVVQPVSPYGRIRVFIAVFLRIDFFVYEKIVGKMINAGIRLLISTHSDYIIRELNNLIMLSSAPEEMNEQLQKWGYTKDMGIKPQEVGAYLFNYGEGENMVNVTPIEVNDYGFEVKTIDDSINKQNEISETLYYELKYEHNK